MYLGNSPPSLLTALPEGKAGVVKTLKIMRSVVRQGKKNPAVRQAAVEITQGLRQKDWIGEVKALWSFVRDRIRYLKDIRGVETIQTPERTLENAQGDCDDKSVLLASLLESIGHPTRFVAIGFTPGKYSHVYVETKIGNKWISLETTEPVNIGWKPPGITNALVIYN